jgi:hypothetical protein
MITLRWLLTMPLVSDVDGTAHILAEKLLASKQASHSDTTDADGGKAGFAEAYFGPN